MKQKLWLGAVAIALLGPFAAAVAAQGALPGLRRSNKELPVVIDAKTLEVHDRSKTATFSGDVRVVQGDTTMRCKTLVVFYGRQIGLGDAKPVVVAGNGDASGNAAGNGFGGVPDAQNIRRIEARGGVTVVTRDQEARGDLGVYDLQSKTITLSGNVVIRQGKNVIHGERVVVNTVTGVAHVESGPGSGQGRVRALIIPNKNQNGGSTNYMTIGPGPTR
jgi:lipopolysaccharide export system protein LptA